MKIDGQMCSAVLKVLNGATNDMMGRANSEDDGHPVKLCRVGPGNFTPSLSQVRT